MLECHEILRKISGMGLEGMNLKKESEKKPLKRKNSWKDLLFLQLIVIIYTLSSIASKMAADYAEVLPKFLLFCALQLGALGVYAILWQQVIKKVDLSVAYANRAIALLWSMLGAVLFFKESINIQNMIGVVIVIAGTIIVNSDDE